jgi:cytochrome o ubiquinol oxidase subunit 1
MFGRLSLESFQHDLFQWGAIATMLFGVAAVIFGLTITKRWTWLWKEWLTSLDHKKIGIMYIVVSFVMLLRGAADAGMIRLQQIMGSGGEGFLSSDHFQQVFTAHGTIMIFFVAMGLMFGLINLVLPLQLGSRDVAFPFLNSVSFWLFCVGVVLINLSLIIGDMAATGWLSYPPLAEKQYSPGVGVDYWIWSIQISGIGSLLSGINFITTIIKERAPGMNFMKMPIFSWTVLASMMLVVAVFPILTATLGMLSLDRMLGMHFFTSDGGGNPMMYINLIWAWGHPEVYILILPAFGIFSEVVATFSRKRIFGYSSMVGATLAICFLSFVVWAHHFFTMGAGANVNAFFGIMTMIIAVPTGVKVFNWLFTMYRGSIRLTSPMVWFLCFVFTFTLGGMTGVLLAVPAFDFQVHNSLFLVAHFHNTIIGGVVFAYIAGFTYWFPKIFGFRLHERLGKWAAYFWVSGFFVAFTPLYILGFMGAVRRLDHYDPSLGWQGLFIVAGVGVVMIVVGVLLQVIQLAVSIVQRRSRRDLSGDPWDGRTLEWSTPSPAPFYNFAVIPTINHRDEWWEQKQSGASLKKPRYEDIVLPRNTGAGIIIAGFVFCAGFGLIWEMWWLVVIGVISAIVSIILRTTNDSTTHLWTAKEIEAHESVHYKERYS